MNRVGVAMGSAHWKYVVARFTILIVGIGAGVYASRNLQAFEPQLLHVGAKLGLVAAGAITGDALGAIAARFLGFDDFEPIGPRAALHRGEWRVSEMFGFVRVALCLLFLMFGGLGVGVIFEALHRGQLVLVVIGGFVLAVSIALLVALARWRIRFNNDGICSRMSNWDLHERFRPWSELTKLRLSGVQVSLWFQDGARVDVPVYSTGADEVFRLAQQALDENRRRGD